MDASTVLSVIFTILLVLVIILAALYFLGRKMEKKQVEQQTLLEAAAQPATILVIDKKKMKMKEAGLPKLVYEKTPKYLQWMKVPIVKAKVGPRVMTLIADDKVFPILPVKTEARVIISGLYITEIKSIRGGSVPTLPKKKGILEKIGLKKSGNSKKKDEDGKKKK